MHPRRPSVTLFLTAIILLAGLLAGCGGGGQSGNGGSQGGESGGAKEQGGEAAKKEGGEAAKQLAPKGKIALGTVTRVRPEGRKMVLKPTTGEQQGAEPMTFKIAKEATVTLDDKEAEVADIKEGQQAQITYVIKNERNKTSEIALFSDGATSPGGGDKTG